MNRNIGDASHIYDEIFDFFSILQCLDISVAHTFFALTGTIRYKNPMLLSVNYLLNWYT